MSDEIKSLLMRYAKPGVLDDEVFARLAAYLAQKIEQLDHARRNGDVTYRTLEKNIQKQNLDEVNQAIEHARALLASRYGEPMRQQLTERLHEMAALKAIMGMPEPRPVRGMPKSARTVFCVAIIVCWKVIRSVEKMPGRQPTASQEPGGVFYEFLVELLHTGHLRGVHTDELHKSILKVAKELERTAPPEPELIDLKAHPTGLWGK